MQSVRENQTRTVRAGWRELVWPKEHGSWSLALEPLVFAMIAAPSRGGAALFIAAIAGFFARRPFRMAIMDASPDRRAAARRIVAILAGLALGACALAIVAAGAAWWPWLVPSVASGVFFVTFDLQQAGREQHAEVAGSFAFAWLPAVFAAMAGWTAIPAAALGVVMLARAVPTVLTIRAFLRMRKTGVRRTILPISISLAAAIAVGWLAWTGHAPWIAAAFAVLLAGRAIVLLTLASATLRASTLGMIEAVIGVAYVLAIGIAWQV